MFQIDMAIPVLAVVGLFLGALTHWFLEAWKDQTITEPELKSLPTIMVMVACIAFLIITGAVPALEALKNPAAAFFAGYAIDSVFKNLFRIEEKRSGSE